jgi:hypothetical protein
MALELISGGVPFVRALPKLIRPKAVPGAKPHLVLLTPGEASLAAHQAAEPYWNLLLSKSQKRSSVVVARLKEIDFTVTHEIDHPVFLG